MLRNLQLPFQVLGIAFFGALLTYPSIASTQDQQTKDPTSLTLEEKEEFLKNGKIVNERPLSVGVTRSLRVTLEYKGMTHDAHIQSINEEILSARPDRRLQSDERDYYGFNVAAYKIDKLLELNMTPPSVVREVSAKPAAVTWWVDDVAMMSLERVRNKIQPPNMENWNKQMYIVRIVNQLISDSDPNMGNLLITKDWKIWTVDRSRAFRPNKKLENPKSLTRCERSLLARLRELNRNLLQQNLKDHLTEMEIEGLDARRQLIVKLFDEEIARKGEDKVLYDFPKTLTPGQPLGKCMLQDTKALNSKEGPAFLSADVPQSGIEAPDSFPGT